MRSTVILTFGLLGAAHPCDAQVARTAVTVGQQVALRIPFASMVVRSDGVNRGVELFADVVRDRNAVKVNGDTNWASAGFGYSGTATISGISSDPTTGRTTITLLSPIRGNLRLTMPSTERQYIFTRLFAPASDSDAVRSEMDSALQRRVFSGAMSAVSKGAQEVLLRILRTTAGPGPVKVIMDAGKPYLVFQARESAYTCDERDDARRYGAMISEVVPPIVDRVGLPDTTLTSSFGFAVVIAMKTKASTPEFSCVVPGHGTEATIYIPADAARLFAARSISLSGLIRRSAVMAGGVLVTPDLGKP
jgi:hypothetical protein